MDEQVAQIVAICNCSPETAKFHLEASKGDIDRAIGSILESGGGRSDASRFKSLNDYESKSSASEEDDEVQNYFAGGEKSGVLMQGRPKEKKSDLVEDILKKAAQKPEDEPSGSGETKTQRLLIFWKNGFSIDDGPLFEYSDPKNQKYLEAINQGRAPSELLNVKYDEPVEVKVDKRMDQEYQAPKKVLKPFSGTGHSLVSPSSGSSMPGTFPAAPPQETIKVQFKVDESLPSTSIQIRLADGTRIVSRFNHSHRVADIRNFINQSRPGEASRRYTLSTTFPNKVFTNDSETIKDAGLLNAVIFQKYV